MGCFGDMEATKQVDSSSVSGPPAWVRQAGQDNYNLAKSILDAGYQPYTGDRVADLSSKEAQAGDLLTNAASSGNPYANTAEQAFNQYGAAPGAKFDFSTVVDNNGPLGSIASYMSPYLAQVLDPTLRAISTQGAKDRMGINANATAAGAYGDARHGVAEGAQRKNEALQVGDATYKSFNDAFSTALGLRSSDLARLFQTQQAQSTADEAALARMRQSGLDLTNLDKYGLSRDLSLSSALGQAGANERAIEQQKMDTDYQEYLRKTGWTNNEIAFLTSILAGTPTEKITDGTQTTSQPDNSGWGAIGTLASAAFSMI
jgi:hypothetical protein